MHIPAPADTPPPSTGSQENAGPPQVFLPPPGGGLGAAQASQGRSTDLTPRSSDEFETLPVGLLTVDRRGVVRSANAQGRRLLGVRRRGAVLSRRLLDRLSAPDRERLLQALAHVGTLSELSFDDVALTDADGQARVVRVQARRPVRGNDVLLVLVDVTQTHARAERAEHEARHDALTGLPNRAHALRMLDEMLERARPAGCGVAVMFIDLDRFKATNDLWGHEAGDALLKEMGMRLRQAAGERGIPARMGGDEFLVLWPDLPPGADAAEWAREVVDAVGQPLRSGDRLWAPTASAGLSLFPRDAPDAPTLLRHADRALYRAKREGRNRLCVYSVEIDAAYLDALRLREDLTRALRRQELHLLFEPQLDLEGLRPCGLASLLRWTHPTLGLLGPDDFLVHGLGGELQLRVATWSIDCLQHHLQDWHTAGALPPRLSLEVSPVQLEASGLEARIHALLDATRLPAAGLQLQVADSVVAQASAQAVGVLASLRGTGVGVALDRVGAGTTRLDALSRIRPESLRVDRGVVARLPEAEEARALVTNVVALSRPMSIRVLADGVQTPQQVDCLRELGVHEIQGPHAGAPMAATAVPQWVASMAR